MRKNIILLSLVSAIVIGSQSQAGNLVTIQKVFVEQKPVPSEIVIKAPVEKEPAKPIIIERLVLANAEGLSLYTFKPDLVNESTCYQSCAKAWPPVLVTAEEESLLTGSISKSTRKDGSQQLTIDGHPVYTYVGDEKAGDIFGEGLGNVWFPLDLKIVK